MAGSSVLHPTFLFLAIRVIPQHQELWGKSISTFKYLRQRETFFLQKEGISQNTNMWLRMSCWALGLILLLRVSAVDGLSRADFPEGFVFGTASSAYQYEGAATEGGRKPSIWDKFARLPGKVVDSSTADVTVDQYHRFKEDIDLMVDLGTDVYRFSIAWTRIFPDGRGDEVNEEGVAYYNALIDRLIEKGITPYVTILHSDTPLALEEEYGSWLSPNIIKDYAAYAETCFKLFGDRVKHWITMNEPHMQAISGYNIGILAPGRCSADISDNCTGGNSSIEPYLVTHHCLLAHAAAVDIYRSKFLAEQGGSIGMTIDASWFEPLTSSPQDAEAAQRGHDFEIGWYLDPLFFGHYPASMRSLVGDRLPSFTEEEAALVKGSLDFLGINHYTTSYATMGLDTPISYLGYYKDHRITVLSQRNGVSIGQQVNGINIVPWGFEKLLEYIRLRYNNPPVIITENGISDVSNSFSNKDKLYDQTRVNYITGYLSSLHNAIQSGSNVHGYFVWSLCDNWEWTNGFTWRFGLYYVDFQDNLKRYPKESAKWFKRFLHKPVELRSSF